MPNELLIIFSFILIYGSIVLFYRLFGKGGLLAFNVLATILANIEVLLLVRAFGIEMTLGNVLFASTFLITDPVCCRRSASCTSPTICGKAIRLRAARYSIRRARRR